MVEVRSNAADRITLNQIVLLTVASLLPYCVEGPDPIVFHTIFGQLTMWSLFDDIRFRMVFDFPPGVDVEIITQFLHVWIVLVLIPFLLNVLLILFSFRNNSSKGSIHIIRYLAVAGVAYSIGLLMMGEILPLPFTPVVFMILQAYQYFAKH